MAKLIASSTLIKAAGVDEKIIKEFVGKVNTETNEVRALHT